MTHHTNMQLQKLDDNKTHEGQTYAKPWHAHLLCKSSEHVHLPKITSNYAHRKSATQENEDDLMKASGKTNFNKVAMIQSLKLLLRNFAHPTSCYETPYIICTCVSENCYHCRLLRHLRFMSRQCFYQCSLDIVLAEGFWLHIKMSGFTILNIFNNYLFIQTKLSTTQRSLHKKLDQKKAHQLI